MKLGYLFDEKLIYHLDVDHQEELFNQVADQLELEGVVTSSYRQALMDREKSFPTGLDMQFLGKELPNVAIPHADVEHSLTEKIVLVKLERPVVFHNMIDPAKEVSVSLAFFIINHSHSSQTNILADLMDFFTGEGHLKTLLNAKTTKEIYDYITQE